MAPLPSTIEVTFTSNFAGDHRICWRLLPNTVYDCSTVVTCAGGGATCTASIAVMLENEACDPLTFDGYVQASCEDVLSLEGRVYFSNVFIPNPVCDSYSVTCINTSVASITVTDPGTGYDPLVAPVVSITLGGGSGATATAIVGNDLGLNNTGSGYTPGTYTNVPLVNVSGTGTGALATITVNGAGSITVPNTTITTTGTGYFPFDTFGVNAADVGGTGANFEARFEADYGTITAINVTAPGSSYETVPTITVPAPAIGITATATAILALCPNQTSGLSCDGSAPDTITGLAINQSAIVCMTALPIILSQYTFVAAACCYDCVTVTFNKAIGGFATNTTVYYTDCTTHEITSVVLANGATSGPICVVNTSWYWTDNGPFTTVVVGAVCP